MPVVAGVDSSTQSCKIELRDLETGALAGSGSAPHPAAFGPCSEQDPVSWWHALEIALGRAVESARIPRSDIRAMSVAAQCHGLVPLDASGKVIRDAKLWNDTTSAVQLERLRARIGTANWVNAAGSLPTAAFTIGKLAWLAETEPVNFAELRRICLPHDWLTLRLSGAHVTDRSDASGTGYYSSHQGAYLTGYLDLIDSGIDWLSLLPQVLGPGEAAGHASPDVIDELGLRADLVLGPGGGDQHAAALGLAVEPGDVVYTIATSGVVFTTATEPVFDLAGIVDGVADMAGGYLPLVSTLNAARVTDWLAGIMGVSRQDLAQLALSADLRQVPAMAPYLDGERKPDLPGARAVMSGLTSGTGRAELARAAHEGVVAGLLWGEARLNDAGSRTDGRLLITGGGARSSAYRQVLADLSGRQVLMADPGDADEATARGAAIQAAAVFTGSQVDAVRQAWAPPTRVAAEPGPDSAGRRDQVLAQYRLAADFARDAAGGAS